MAVKFDPTTPASQQWITDLRSGEFGQCMGTLTMIRDYMPGETITLEDLKARGRHCCLGVLCYRQVEAGLIGFTVDAEGRVMYGTNLPHLRPGQHAFEAMGEDTGEWSASTLPPAVARLVTSDPVEDEHSHTVFTQDHRDVVVLNDNIELPFTKIADALTGAK